MPQYLFYKWHFLDRGETGGHYKITNYGEWKGSVLIPIIDLLGCKQIRFYFLCFGYSRSTNSKRSEFSLKIDLSRHRFEKDKVLGWPCICSWHTQRKGVHMMRHLNHDGNNIQISISSYEPHKKQSTRFQEKYNIFTNIQQNVQRHCTASGHLCLVLWSSIHILQFAAGQEKNALTWYLTIYVWQTKPAPIKSAVWTLWRLGRGRLPSEDCVILLFFSYLITKIKSISKSSRSRMGSMGLWSPKLS